MESSTLLQKDVVYITTGVITCTCCDEKIPSNTCLRVKILPNESYSHDNKIRIMSKNRTIVVLIDKHTIHKVKASSLRSHVYILGEKAR